MYCSCLLSFLAVLLSLCISVSSIIFPVLLLVSPLLWPVLGLYLLWIFLDRETPFREGRSVSWVRKSAGWHHLRNFFPQTLVRTADLPPSSNYMLCLVPHGIFSTSALCNFFSQTSDFFKYFPGINVTPVTLAVNFYIPFYRDLVLALGMCSVAKESILYRLRKPGGQAVLIVPGGSAEAFASRGGAYNLVLRQRKGFIRLALQTGVSVVPVVAYGETDVYRQVTFPEGSLIYRLQEWIRKATGVAPCLAYGNPFFFLLPRKVPVTTVVGRPIPMEKIENPSQDQIDKYHENFLKELTNLFEQHKDKYIFNSQNVHLNIM